MTYLPPVLLKAHSQSNKLDKQSKKSFFIIEKILKYRNCPALLLNARFLDKVQKRPKRPVLY